MKNIKILNFILKYFVVILLLFPFLWIGYLIFFWGGFGMSYEVPGNKLTETYLNIGDYSIGKQKWFYNICSKKDGCLDGEILGFSRQDNNINLYIKINHGNGLTGHIKFYNYNLFKGKSTLFESNYKYNYNITVNDLNDLPKYGYLSNDNLKFYSENDLKNLPENQQNIFKELEKNPTIVINGVDYTKK